MQLLPTTDREYSTFGEAEEDQVKYFRFSTRQCIAFSVWIVNMRNIIMYYIFSPNSKLIDQKRNNNRVLCLVSTSIAVTDQHIKFDIEKWDDRRDDWKCYCWRRFRYGHGGEDTSFVATNWQHMHRAAALCASRVGRRRQRMAIVCRRRRNENVSTRTRNRRHGRGSIEGLSHG